MLRDILLPAETVLALLLRGNQKIVPRGDTVLMPCDEAIEPSVLHKISQFCNVKEDCVIENVTLPVLYQAPLMLEKNGLARITCRELQLDCPEPDMREWNAMLTRIEHRSKDVTIAIVGKYVRLHDAYLSVAEALQHAGFENSARVHLVWIEAEDVTDATAKELLGGCDGILVPGGFGDRGIEGKIAAARYARTHNVPYFGICLGMQIAVIEFARGVLEMEGANSTEFSPNGKYPVIDLMPDQHGVVMGGPMRLGAYPCKIAPGSHMESAYGDPLIYERHRHRYEFNNNFREQMLAAGLSITGTSPDNHLVEAVEIPENRFFVGVQYHPEFKSRPNHAHPLFREFVKASLAAKSEK